MTTSRVPADLAATAEGDHTHAPPAVVTVTVARDDPRFWPIVRAVLYAESSPAAGSVTGSPEARELRPDVPTSFPDSAAGGEAPGPRRAGASPTKQPKHRKGRPSTRRRNAQRRRLITLVRRVKAIRREIRRLKKRR